MIFGISRLKRSKFSSRLIFKCRIRFSFSMEFYIELNKLIYSAVFNILFASPEAISNNKLTELSAPVAKMIDAYALISCKFMKLLEGVTNNCCTEVTDVERLGYIRR